MALSDPRAAADFASLLKVKSVTWAPRRNDQVDGLGSGDVLLTELASPLFAPQIVCDWMDAAEGRRIDARLTSLTGLRQFYLADPRGTYPAADPDGAVLGANAIAIHSIGADNASVAFSGFPAGYELTEGDFWHVDFSANPTRRGFFQLSEPATADGTGITPEIACFPAVWTGIEVGMTAVFANPAMKCVLLPGAVTNASFSGTKATGMAFTALQKL